MESLPRPGSSPARTIRAAILSGDLAAGADGDVFADPAVGFSLGAVHVLFLNANGSVKSTVEINFGGVAGLAYKPKCIKIKSGTTLTFKGSFDIHPLALDPSLALDSGSAGRRRDTRWR